MLRRDIVRFPVRDCKHDEPLHAFPAACYRLRKPPVKSVGFISDVPDAEAAIRLAIAKYRGPAKWHGHLIALREP